MSISVDAFRAIGSLVPAETPAIADGTSQPWTPPADISREAYDALAYEVASAFCEPGPHREALRQTRFPGPYASRRGVLVRCLDDAAVSAARSVLAGAGLRYELPTHDTVLALPRAAPAAPTAESGGILSRWPKYEVSADELRAQRDALTERVAELEAEVGRLTRERDEARRVGEEALTRATAAEAERDRLRGDRRFELVKAAMASGRDGYTAVRDADEALGAMGGPKAARADLAPPGKGESVKALAAAREAIASARSYLDAAVKELGHATAPDWDEAAEALRCAALGLDEARAAVKAAEGGGA